MYDSQLVEIHVSYDIENFEPWSGAVDTWDNLFNYNKLNLFAAILYDQYPEGIDEMTLNDILWFEPEYVYDSVGLDYDQYTGEVTI